LSGSRDQLLIFDLDGTLIDSSRDLADSVNAMLRSMGREPLPDEIVFSYVGNGAPVLCRRALGEHVSEDDVVRGLRFFLDYYREHMLDATILYPGVREALDCFHDAGIPMAVLTNKPVRFSLHLLQGLGVEMHFFRVYGGNSFEEKKPHPRGIELLMAESGAKHARTIMVGDSAVDVRTARNAGVVACGVTWGLQPETLELDPPDFLISEMGQLTERVLLTENPARADA
jgi:phosphoglycolate phosphatase